jgi:hypothetical protein
LPAALTAQGAKALAQFRMAAFWAGRARAKIALGWRSCGARPGTVVQIKGDPTLWRVERWTLGRMSVSLDLTRISSAPLPELGASPGRPVTQPDLPHGPTRLRLIELPLFGVSLRDRPQLVAATAGTLSGWRRASLLTSVDGGQSWEEAGPSGGGAVLGQAVTAVVPGSSALFDDRSTVEVELLNESMWLESRSDAALAGGANLAVLGEELIQFGRAEPLGSRRFRLSRLLRGRRGTEWASAGHAAGEDFTMIEAAAVTPIELPEGSVGGEIMVMASGIGDDDGAAVAQAEVAGLSLRPPSPVHLRAKAAADGAVLIEWVRRSRLGWDWNSGSDTPLAEEAEAYQLRLTGGSAVRTLSLSEPRYLYMAAERASDGAVAGFSMSVTQIGTLGVSRPAELSFP